MNFVIPVMFLACLRWEVSEPTTISGFRFEQPVTIVARADTVVEIHNVEFYEVFSCYAIEATENSMVDVGGTINFEGATHGIGLVH